MTPHILSGPRPEPGLLARLLAAALAISVVCAVPSIASAAAFDPNYVISDDNFRAAGSMSAADVQAFLAAANPVGSTSSALKLLVTADHTGVSKSAAAIIAEAAAAWQVSPKVLLVTLQKEQSLLTRTAPSQTALDWALGFGCPDGVAIADRDPAYKGFGTQVWLAAQKLNGYGEISGSAGYPWNKTRVFNDNGFTALPRNIATYKLYIYTPHVGYPDVKNNYIHGNLLFWNAWNKWPAYLGDPLADPTNRPVYRFFNMRLASHFYTASEAERFSVVSKLSSTYRYEGIAYSLDTSNTANSAPLYRFFNMAKGSHFYTASEVEKASVIARLSKIYRYEGPAYNVSLSPDGAAPVYRFYNVKNGTHFYTASAAEKDSVVAKLASIYHFEGVAFYLAP